VIPGNNTEEKLARIAKINKADTLAEAVKDETDAVVIEAVQKRITELTSPAPKADESAASKPERRLVLVNALSYSYPGNPSFSVSMGDKTPHIEDDEVYEYLKNTHYFEEPKE
jgi:hypothetical protein